MTRFKLDNLKLNNSGITLQTVIITAILALAAIGAGLIIYNIVSDEAEDIEEVSSSLGDITPAEPTDSGDTSSTATTGQTTDTTTGPATGPIPTTGTTPTTVPTTSPPTTENTGQTDQEIFLPPGGFTPPAGFLYPGGFVEPVSASRISSSYQHSCAILENKQIRCWGYNSYGQLGDETVVSRDIPVAVKGISGADEVSAGSEFSCALLEDGTIRCWGRNQFGQLGDGTTNDRQSPVQVLGIDGTTPATTATRIAVGLGHICALLGDNTIQCWGNGTGGQLGNGESDHQSTPVLVTGINAPNGAIQVSTGIISTCALLVDNTVQCWGDNRFGQLGNDSVTITSSVPVTVTGIDGTDDAMSATQISVGGTALAGHACALLEDGTVKCWGSNNYGQLGDGSTTNSRVPTAVTGIVDAVNVSAGRLHTCAVLTDGEIRCWGFNSSGQLGDNTFTNKLVPTRVVDISIGSKVFSGENHTCALLTTGFIRCWGSNSAGQLGTGSAQPATAISSVQLSGQVSASKFSSSYSHSCVILQDGTVGCWGVNDKGQLGDGTTENRDSLVTVIGITAANAATEIAAGGDFTCAILSDKTVRCWGSNEYGQLGNGTTTDSLSPVQVLEIDGTAPYKSAISISAGLNHVCIILEINAPSPGSADRGRCWGRGDSGQLANSLSENQSTPVPTSRTDTRPFQISAGATNTCAIIDERKQEVACSGNNDFGQLTDGTTTSDNTGLTIEGLGLNPFALSQQRVTQVSVGAGHICAILTDETVRCWGLNDFGQVGDGSTTNRLTIVEVTGLTDVAQISAGVKHTCAVLQDGTVQCWGSNEFGQLGNNTFVDELTPTAVVGISGVSEVFAGDAHTCALLSTGFVQCWGLNSMGELGTGQIDAGSARPAATIISSQIAATATQVSAGFFHTCVLIEGGAAQCWGNNSFGRLGDGTENSRSAAAGVIGIDGATPERSATQISAGVESTCALLEDQSIKCWGRNEFGQLGFTTTDPTLSLTPVTVDGISGTAGERATQVAVGQWHACALLEDETVSCWGDDRSGQLGNASVPRNPGISLTPVAVSGITTATQISVGAFHSCALLQDKTIQCWGRNVAGRIGNGDLIFNSNFRSPVTVVTITNAIQVSAGYFNTCALLEDKTVSCWGNNQEGQLGDDTTVDSSTPIPVVGINNVARVSVGNLYMCALLENNRVSCWGDNEVGQLGDGTLNDRTRPTRDSVASPVAQISDSKYQHTCVLLVDTTVQCWGEDSQGQLGNLAGRPTPSRVIIFS